MPATAHRLPLATSSSLNSIFSQIRGVITIIADWQAQARERRSLARLDNRLLDDIGLNRERQGDTCSQFFLALTIAGDCPTIRNRIAHSRNW